MRQYNPIELRYDTPVDQGLSPFSEEYCRQQIKLYREISGRDLAQEEGELHFGEFSHLISAPNPIGMAGPAVAESVRTLAALLSLADLEGGCSILDMGAGHGLSSEIFAYSGYRVHAVDIDPMLGELSRSRSQARGLDISRSTLNFDDLSSLEDGKYAAAFFFQSMHHCIRPWQLIASLKEKLVDHGIIGFSGEPIQSNWWRHWGLRLDGGSLFWMRAFGWFESGWSHDFIRECFARSGMRLMFFTGGYMGGEIGIAAIGEAKCQAVIRRATQIGLRHIDMSHEVPINEARFTTAIGEPCNLFGSRAFRQRVPGEGVLLFGPYVALGAGDYEVSLLVRRAASGAKSDPDARLVLDVVSAMGITAHARAELTQHIVGRTQDATLRLHLPVDTSDVEIRAIVTGNDLWTVSLPRLSPLPSEARSP